MLRCEHILIPSLNNLFIRLSAKIVYSSSCHSYGYEQPYCTTIHLTHEDKKYIICISKCDFDKDEDNSDILENKDYIYISSFTKYGIDNLKDKIFTNL